MRLCTKCNERNPQLIRSYTREPRCKICFIEEVEEEVHDLIVKYNLIRNGDRIVIGVSGGKDSSALVHCLQRINERYNMGAHLLMLAIDEGIFGYRDDSLKCVYEIEKKYGLPLEVISYTDLYDGWTMDSIVDVKGSKRSCTYCGILRRHALEVGARRLKATAIATGHNADDTIETLLMNFLRGDFKRLMKSSSAETSASQNGGFARIKPFYFISQREVVLYCHILGLDYFSTECTYAHDAFRGYVRRYVKEIEGIDPQVLGRMLTRTEDCLAQLRSGFIDKSANGPDCKACIKCELPCISADGVCQACNLISEMNSR